MIELYEGDCLEVMPTLPDGCADMILADLPYGTTACKWDSVIPFAPLWEQYKRLIKPNGAIVLFGSQPFTSALVMSNPDWFRYEWIWEKTYGGGFLSANHQPMKRHENILVFSESRPTYTPQKHKGAAYSRPRSAGGGYLGDKSSDFSGWITQSDGWRYPTSVLEIANDKGLHPTQKPVKLLQYFIRTYTNKGETVLDNTMGSGSTGAACIEEGRRFIGIEQDSAYFEIARRRLEAEQVKPRTMRMELDAVH